MTSKISYSKFIRENIRRRGWLLAVHDPDVFHADALDRDADRNASFRFRSLSESRCSLSGKSAFCRIFETGWKILCLQFLWSCSLYAVQSVDFLIFTDQKRLIFSIVFLWLAGSFS